MALELLRAAARVYARTLQGLRGKATQAVDVAGVETPHDRAGEVLRPGVYSNGPQEPPLPSGAPPRTNTEAVRRYKCSQQGRQRLSMTAATPTATQR